MAKSVDKRYEEIYNLGINEHNKNKETKKQTAQSDKQIINANADANIENITNNYNTQIADTNKSYENAFQQNEVQVKLNERYLERKAAEMGLTDSGLNRTQMTANQLSYANQKGELTRQRQKAVDTLAATMRSKITEVDTNRNNQIAQIDSTLNNNLAQLDANYASSVRQQAVDTYNAEYKAEKEAETARIKAEQEAITAAKKANSDAYAKLVDSMIKDDLDEEQKINAFKAYCSMYDFDSREQAQATLDYAGIDGTIDNEGNLILNDSYSSSGKTQSYTIRKTKDTKNGFLGLKGLFGGIDSNDTYEIVDDATEKVIKSISNIDDFSSLTNAQKKQLSDLNIDDELSTDDFKFSADGLRRFIKSIS